MPTRATGEHAQKSRTDADVDQVEGDRRVHGDIGLAWAWVAVEESGPGGLGYCCNSIDKQLGKLQRGHEELLRRDQPEPHPDRVHPR